MLPHTLNRFRAAGIFQFSLYVFLLCILQKKKLLKCHAVVRLCKCFLLRSVAAPRSCKKKLEGTLFRVHARIELLAYVKKTYFMSVVLYIFHPLQNNVIDVNRHKPIPNAYLQPKSHEVKIFDRIKSDSSVINHDRLESDHGTRLESTRCPYTCPPVDLAVLRHLSAAHDLPCYGYELGTLITCSRQSDLEGHIWRAASAALTVTPFIDPVVS
jgi:hypothetical protein